MAQRRQRRPELTVLPGAPGRPLYDLEAETSVLGSLLIDRSGAAAVKVAALGLAAEHYYRENNGTIHRAALALHGEGEPIDNVTLAAALATAGLLERIGGRAHLALLQESVPTAANVEHYARIVIECAAARAELAEHRRAVEAHGYTLLTLGQGAEPTEDGGEADPLLSGTLPIAGSEEYRYRPATETDPGAVVRLTRQGPRLTLTWAPRVEAVYRVRDRDDEDVDTIYAAALDGRPARLRASELRAGSVWDAIPVSGTGERRVRDVLFNIVRQQGTERRGTEIIASTRTGWHDLDGQPVYVYPDGRTYPETARVQLVGLPAAVARAGAPPAAVPHGEELRASLRALVDDRAIATGRAAGVLALEFGAGVRSLGASWALPLTSLVLEAGSDSGKSGVAMAARGAVLDVTYPPVTTSSLDGDTAGAIEGGMSREVDMPTLADDLTEMTSAGAALLNKLWRPTADGKPMRQRLRRDLTPAPSTIVRTLPTYTVEALPPELAESALRRAFVVAWTADNGHVAARCVGSGCAHDGERRGDAACLRGHLERAWPAMRATADLVIVHLAELGAEAGARELTELDTAWRSRLGVMTADAPGAHRVAERAAPLLAGLELAERVTGLQPGELTEGAARAAALHMAVQGQRLMDRQAFVHDLAPIVGDVIRRALLDRRAHVLNAHGALDTAAVPDLEPVELGYREVRSGDDGPEYTADAGVPCYAWPNAPDAPDGIALKGENLYKLLIESRDARFAGRTKRGLVGLLLERGALLPSAQEDQAAAWTLTLPGGTQRRVVVIPRSLVFPTDGPDGPVLTSPLTSPPGDVSAGPAAGTPLPSSNPAPQLAALTSLTPLTSLTSASLVCAGARAREESDPEPEMDPAELASLEVAMATDDGEDQDQDQDEPHWSVRAPHHEGEVQWDRGNRWVGRGGTWLRQDEPAAETAAPARSSTRRRKDPGADVEPKGSAGGDDPMKTTDGAAPAGEHRTAPTTDAAQGSRAPRRAEAAAAVLGARGLHLPAGELLYEFDVRQRGKLADVLTLMSAYRLRQLWVHAEALPLLGLPAELRQRSGRSLDLENRAAAIPHRWTTEAAGAGWRIVAGETADGADVVGLRPWWTAYPPGAGADLSGWIEVYVLPWCAPEWCEFEADIAYLARGASPAEVLAGLELYAKHIGARFRRSPGTTGAALIATTRRTPLPERVPMPDGAHGPIPEGDRMTGPPRLPDAAEKTAEHIHAWDANAQYLAAAGVVHLGQGTMHRVDAPELAELDPGKLAAGRYRARLSLPDGRRTLPGPLPFVSDGRPHWYSPSVLALARKLGCGVELVDGWAWETSSRALERWYELLRDARTAILAGGDGAAVARLLLKRTYAAGVGRLAYLAPGRPETYPLYRPEWQADVRTRANVNLYRHVYAVAERTGRTPIAAQADTVAYVCSEADPAAAAATLGLEVSDKLGKFKHAGTVPLAWLRERLAAGGGDRARKDLFDALRASRVG